MAAVAVLTLRDAAFHGPPATILPCHTPPSCSRHTLASCLLSLGWHSLLFTGTQKANNLRAHTYGHGAHCPSRQMQQGGEHVCASAPVGGVQALQSWSLCLGSSCTPLHYHLQDCCTSATICAALFLAPGHKDEIWPHVQGIAQ